MSLPWYVLVPPWISVGLLLLLIELSLLYALLGPRRFRPLPYALGLALSGFLLGAWLGGRLWPTQPLSPAGVPVLTSTAGTLLGLLLPALWRRRFGRGRLV